MVGHFRDLALRIMYPAFWGMMIKYEDRALEIVVLHGTIYSVVAPVSIFLILAVGWWWYLPLVGHLNEDVAAKRSL